MSFFDANYIGNDVKYFDKSESRREKSENLYPQFSDYRKIPTFITSDGDVYKKAYDLLREMDHHVSRPIKDALILLLATVFVVPLMRKLTPHRS
jgi:hypothetical protein